MRIRRIIIFASKTSLKKLEHRKKVVRADQDKKSTFSGSWLVVFCKGGCYAANGPCRTGCGRLL